MDRFHSAEFEDILGVLDNGDGGNLLDFDTLNDAMFAFEEQNQLSINPYAVSVTTGGPGGVYGIPMPAAYHGIVKVEGGQSTSPPSDGQTGENSDQTAANTIHVTASMQPGFSSGLDAAEVSRPKKKRTRNQEQMHLNRIAQQKYRERKKAEYNDLQTAVDQLAAQLAAFKALEVRTEELERSNYGLQSVVARQAHQIGDLEGQVSTQAATISSQAAKLSEAAAIAVGQQKMILQQHTKLQLQEEVIVALKDRLKSSIESAMSHVDEGTVCEKLLAAVKSALYGAKDVEGLQDVLEKLPEHLVVEICKNIFHACKELWPELYQRCTSNASRCTSGMQLPAVRC